MRPTAAGIGARFLTLVRTRAPIPFCIAVVMAPVLAQAPSSPRLDPVPASAWNDAIREVVSSGPLEDMPNLVGAYANHPEAAGALLPHLEYIWSESTLPDRHRALLSLRALWLTRSRYLWLHRGTLAIESEGITPPDLVRIAEGPDAEGWDDFEATLLRAADELYVDAFISDATWKTLATRYDLAQLIDTIDTVGALTMNAGLVNSLGVRLEPVGLRDWAGDVAYRVAAERTNIRLVDKAPRIPPEIPEDANFAANVFYTFRHNPAADRVRGAINTQVTGRSTLDPLHREFLLVRIGTLCRSEYEYAAHLRVGRRAGMTDDDLAMILADPADRNGSPEKLALLAATDELYDNDVISDVTWEKLDTFLSDEQLIDLLVAVGGYRSTSMLINSAGVQLDANMADFRFPAELR